MGEGGFREEFSRGVLTRDGKRLNVLKICNTYFTGNIMQPRVFYLFTEFSSFRSSVSFVFFILSLHGGDSARSFDMRGYT